MLLFAEGGGHQNRIVAVSRLYYLPLSLELQL